MQKRLSINNKIHKSILSIQRIENRYGYGYQSYSKIVNYLVILGLDNYRDLNPKNKTVSTPQFDFDKYTRTNPVKVVKNGRQGQGNPNHTPAPIPVRHVPFRYNTGGNATDYRKINRKVHYGT